MSEDHREMRWEVNVTPPAVRALFRDLTWEQAHTEGMSEDEFAWGKSFCEEVLPTGMKMPKDAAAQRYELRRMFRL